MIAEFPDVDWRHPFFTCPISWRAIFRNYKTVELSPKGQLLLERRERPLVETLKTMTRQNFGVGEWVPVPRAPQYVLARISLRKTFLGKLRELLYRTDPVFIDLAYINGTYSHFRMVPLQAENGILLSCLPSAIDGFKDLFLLTPKQRVAYFLITGPGTKSFNKCCQVEFDDASYH